jgi:hypothetical protein
MFMAQPASAQTSLDLNVTDAANALWDLSATERAQYIDIDIETSDGGGATIRYPAPCAQDGGGKIKGAGATDATLEYESDSDGWVTAPVRGASYVTTGSISSSKGVARFTITSKVAGTATMEGQDRKVTASATTTATLNSATKTWTGRYSNRASASGMGGIADSGSFGPEDIFPDLGDGSWTLHIDFNPMAGNKITGSATVTLATGKVFEFGVTGTYVPKTQQSKVSLRGKNSGMGSVLSVVMLADQIKSVSGKISGQTVSIVQ